MIALVGIRLQVLDFLKALPTCTRPPKPVLATISATVVCHDIEPRNQSQLSSLLAIHFALTAEIIARAVDKAELLSRSTKLLAYKVPFGVNEDNSLAFSMVDGQRGGVAGILVRYHPK